MYNRFVKLLHESPCSPSVHIIGFSGNINGSIVGSFNSLFGLGSGCSVLFLLLLLNGASCQSETSATDVEKELQTESV